MDVYSRTTKHRKSPARIANDIVRRAMGKPTKPFITETTVTSTMPFKGAKKRKLLRTPKVKGVKAWYPSGPTSNGIGVGP